RIAREHQELACVLDEPSVTALTAAAAAQMRSLFESLASEFRGRLPGRRIAAESWLTAILVEALRRKLEVAPVATHPRSPDSQLTVRYRSLIDTNYRTQMSIADYARTLCVSTERLRLACVRS